jgi:hypothetical protein
VRAARACVGLAILVVALGTAGCARDGDAATVQSVTDTFFAAVASGDGERACEQLSPDTRAALESQEQAACRDAVTEIKLDPAAVVSSSVYILNAVVELSYGDAVFLDQGEEGWRIAAVGCKPSAKPDARPFECELED